MRMLACLFVIVFLVGCAGHKAGRTRGWNDWCAQVSSCGSYCSEWNEDDICIDFVKETSEYCADILTSGRSRC